MITMGGKKKNGGKGSDVVAIILERSCAQQLAIALALALGGVSPLGPKKGKGGKGGKSVKGAKGVIAGGGGGGKKGGKK
jgi:hypothetical protein